MGGRQLRPLCERSGCHAVFGKELRKIMAVSRAMLLLVHKLCTQFIFFVDLWYSSLYYEL